ncbi:DUF3068 domain-containing protein [Leekyejoonella antrihumi]|uniref:DUF3068 domain-containing protein n=1 Tax=Leekyejoonella antrihumi TaxID=1660198 RepID=A0A563E3N8_9MICO|nr:DUF3068 domain-containing protein [Leekyejoonella antrihumi]TWP37138.1 DUF3068 domain-containing protein [Leekyejoonella antrihumi]
MRKTAVVIGFGAFFLTMALLLKFYAYNQLTVVPKDQNTGQTLVDPNATFFDAPTLTIMHGKITTQLVAVVDQKASDTQGGNARVFNVWQSTTHNNSRPPMAATTQRVALNAHTGLPVHCCDESENGKPVKYAGYTLKFPFSTQKTTYQYWDTTIEKPMSMKYADTEKIDGLTVYKFVGDVPKTTYTKMEVPGFLFGLGKTSPAVNADRTYSVHRIIWVEPQTGAFIKVQEQQQQLLEDPGHPSVQALSTTSTFTPATVKGNVNEYKSKASQLKILQILPWILGILGIILLILGIIMAGFITRGRHEARDEGYDGGLGDELYDGSTA